MSIDTKKPSEHAMGYALKFYREVATVFDEQIHDDDEFAVKMAHEIDQHAIAPAVAASTQELMDFINNPHRVHAHYLRIGNGWEVWTSERVRGMEKRIAELEAEVDRLKRLCADCDQYQFERANRLEVELSRLKANIGCAREQGSTQYCAEVLGRDKRIAELEQLLSGRPLKMPLGGGNDYTSPQP